MKLSDHFGTEEMKCHCGQCVFSTEEGVHKTISHNLLLLLEDIRAYIGEPIGIASGLRCPEYNAKVGGEPNSAHCQGYAADIICPTSAKRYLLTQAAMTKGCRRIGQYKDKTIIHVDVAPEPWPQDVEWVK